MSDAKVRALKVLRAGKRIEREAEAAIGRVLRGEKLRDKTARAYVHPWSLQNPGEPAIVDEMKKAHCCGCSSCMNSCPVGAISMVEDEEGFLYPQVDRDACINCGACVKHCPTYVDQPRNWPTEYCYATVCEDETVRGKSSSGGLFTQFAQYTFAQGGVVFGAAYVQPDKVAHRYVEDEKDLDVLRRSKYVQSEIGDTYRQAKDFLKAGRFVLFTGCPCQIAGLYAYLGKDYENLLTVDLICHGTPSPGLFRRYVQERYGEENVSEVNFRDKSAFGWSTHMNVYLNDGSVEREVCSKDAYYKMFLPCLAMRPFCSICKYTRLPRVADLSIGDWWGIEKYDKTLNDGKGTSLLLVNNERGCDAFLSILGSMKRCEEYPLSAARPRNYTIDKPFRAHPARARFFNLLKRHSFDKSVRDALSWHYDVGIYGLWYGENYGSMLTYYGLRNVLESMGLSTLMIFNPLSKRQADLEPYRFARRQGYLMSKARPLSQMHELNEFCDSFVLGSDQLWNPGLSRPYGFSYFLSFVEEGNKRIAYGTSFGKATHKIEERYRKRSAYELAKFDAISVRDDFSKAYLEQYYDGTTSTKVLDPALLCDPGAYRELASKATPNRLVGGGTFDTDRDYLFAYLLDPTPETLPALGAISNAMGMEVLLAIDYSPRARKKNLAFFENSREFGVSVLDVASCEQWLQAIEKARAVLTDSFHGMLFSHVFDKDFVAVPNKKRGAGRFEDVLATLDLENRMVDSYTDDVERVCSLLSEPIDYEKSNALLEQQRRLSRDWLEEALKKPKRMKTNRSYLRIEEQRAPRSLQ